MNKIKGETEEAYTAFLNYIEVDGISMEAAWRNYSNDSEELVPDQWHIWFSKFKWDERLQEAQDADIQRKVERTYQQQLIEFQGLQSKRTNELNKSMVLLIRRVRAALAKLDPETIPPGQIPNYINAITRLVDTIQKHELEGLGIADLLEQLAVLNERQVVDTKTTPTEIKPIGFDFSKLKNGI
jgi:hypothetical protein